MNLKKKEMGKIISTIKRDIRYLIFPQFKCSQVRGKNKAPSRG